MPKKHTEYCRLVIVRFGKNSNAVMGYIRSAFPRFKLPTYVKQDLKNGVVKKYKLVLLEKANISEAATIEAIIKDLGGVTKREKVHDLHNK